MLGISMCGMWNVSANRPSDEPVALVLMHTRQKMYAFEATVLWLYHVFPHYLLNSTSLFFFGGGDC